MPAKIGFFDIQHVLAASSVGPVYRALHSQTGETARVYVLEPGEGARDQLARDQLAREFERRRRVASLLNGSPRSWTWLGDGCDSGVEYYVLAEPRGETLASYVTNKCLPSLLVDQTLYCPPLRQENHHHGNGSDIHPSVFKTPGRMHGRVSPWVARGWLSDLASVVDRAHHHGVVLGNLSPYNIWIGQDGSAMLMDAGNQGSLEIVADYTGGSASAGSLAVYLAPEQLLGRHVGPLADIYGLGAILFWLLGGEFPPSRYGDTTRIGRYLPLPSLDKDTDPELKIICEKATAVQASSRYSGADLLRAALLSIPHDLAAATTRASHGSRCTLIQGLRSRPGALPVPAHPRAPSPPSAPSRLGRWLRDLLFA